MSYVIPTVSRAQKAHKVFVEYVPQKKSRMKSLVTKLRDRVAGLQLKIEQLQIDNEALRYTFCHISRSVIIPAVKCDYVA